MPPLTTSTVPQQVAEHLRNGLLRGRWNGKMPGRDLLAEELKVSPRSVQEALKILEKERLLVPQGPGRRSRIVLPKGQAAPAMRIQVLLRDQSATQDHYMIGLIHQLQQAGHHAAFASRTLVDLDMDAKRVIRFAKKASADAWVVCAGPKDVLEWFAAQSIPTFALFGRSKDVPLASAKPDKLPAERIALERLIELGHREIVRLSTIGRRKPVPGIVEQSFLDTLEAAGIKTGPHNLPDWKEDRAGVHRCLDSLFRKRPPTALILDVAALYFAAHQHISRRGLRIPEDVSLVSSDPHPIFEWSDPPVSHIQWDASPLVDCIRRWANNVARGRDDRRKSLTKATFIEGGTIGPAPKR